MHSAKQSLGRTYSSGKNFRHIAPLTTNMIYYLPSNSQTLHFQIVHFKATSHVELVTDSLLFDGSIDACAFPTNYAFPAHTKAQKGIIKTAEQTRKSDWGGRSWRHFETDCRLTLPYPWKRSNSLTSIHHGNSRAGRTPGAANICPSASMAISEHQSASADRNTTACFTGSG